jgi:hypothetical protein
MSSCTEMRAANRTFQPLFLLTVQGSMPSSDMGGNHGKDECPCLRPPSFSHMAQTNARPPQMSKTT